MATSKLAVGQIVDFNFFGEVHTGTILNIDPKLGKVKMRTTKGNEFSVRIGAVHEAK
jgi:hypothetical protein